jgi:hypothetical protein
MKAERQESGTFSVGEESEVADAHESWRQHMEQKSAQELIDFKSHGPLLVAVRGVSPAEGDVAIGESDQPAVGDGDAMSVSAEIAQHMFRSSEGPLGIDDPVLAEQHTQPGPERTRLGQRQQATEELELTSMECVAKSGDELAAEDTAEHADGQEEGAPGGDPAGVIRSEAAGGNYTVDMGMKLQALIPTVQHAEETDLGTKMPGIVSDLKQGLSAGMEEQVVNEPLVLQGERGQLPRQRENCMDIAGGQKLPFPRLEPAHACVALASWAMPIPARVVGDFGRLSAAGAAVAMST